MAIDPQILLQGRPLDLSSVFSNVLSNVSRLDAIKQNRQTSQQQQQQNRLRSVSIFGAQVSPMLQSGDIEGARRLTQQRIEDLDRQNVPSNDSQEFLQLLDNNPQLAAQRAGQAVQIGQRLGFFAGQQGQTATQRERADIVKVLQDPNATETEKQLARVAGGIEARAVGAAAKTVDVGGVPHVFDPVKQTLVPATVGGEIVTAETVGESQAIIRQRGKFGELTAVSRSKAIDKGFDRISGINKNIDNIDRALGALSRGAGTGAAEKFFPSIKAASVELNQIQGELALDVIGAVTFGALSQGELDLARDIALPTGLDEPELIDFLNRKKLAQEKLRDYFNEQIQFLDQRGTVAGFLRSRQGQQGGSQQAIQQPAQQIIRFDAQGNIIQ